MGSTVLLAERAAAPSPLNLTTSMVGFAAIGVLVLAYSLVTPQERLHLLV